MKEIAKGHVGDKGEMRTTESLDSTSDGVGGGRKGTAIEIETEMETDMEY